MTAQLAGVIAGTFLVLSGIVAMAAISHCHVILRVWPGLLLAAGSLMTSDRLMRLFMVDSPLEDVRSWLTVLGVAGAFGTVTTMAWLITTACPICRGTLPREQAPPWFRAYVEQRDEESKS